MPENRVIIFADQDRENFDLGNLILVSRAELCVANKKGLLHNDANLTKSGVLVAKIISKVSSIKKKYRG